MEDLCFRSGLRRRLLESESDNDTDSSSISEALADSSIDDSLKESLSSTWSPLNERDSPKSRDAGLTACLKSLFYFFFP